MMSYGLRPRPVFCLLLLAGPLLLALFGGVVADGQGAGQAPPQVYLEDSPAAQDLADRALALRDQGRFADAAQMFQRVIDEYPFKLMSVDERRYTDAVLWVRAQLLGDARLLASYRASFGPSAQRALSLALPTADTAIDAEALREVLSRYALTPAGLEAGLALGSYYLERAGGADAAGVLDTLVGHPDLPTHAGRYHFQRALAAMLTGDSRSYDEHRGLLEQAADQALLSELDAMSNRMHPPLRLRHGSGQEPIASRLPAALDVPLWQVRLSQDPQAQAARANLRGTTAAGQLARVQPVGDGLGVYINLGDRINAYDQASGWPLWEVKDQPTDPGADPRSAALRRSAQRRYGPRGVLIQGDMTYAVLGFGNIQPRQRVGQAVTASLVCIDTVDGRVLWRIVPGDLDPALAKGFFYGTPTGDRGRVYTLVKRVAVSGLHDLYLTAVDAGDGTLLWRRHLSSSSTQGAYSAGAPARMITRGGRVYVSDSYGTVVSVDGRTGTVRWVTLLPDAGQAAPNPRRPAAGMTGIAGPVLVDAGLIVSPTRLGGSHSLLDKQTGRLLRVLNDGDWPSLQAVYAAGGDVLGVGADVSLLDGRSLQTRWRTKLDPERYGSARGRPAVDVNMTYGPSPDVAFQGDPTAQAGVASGLAFLCTDRRLIALGLGDGRVVADQPLSQPGNLWVSPGQVIVVGATELGSYMDWPVAQQQLRAQGKRSPMDPRPGLALGYLGLRVGQDRAVLEGVDAALKALARQAPAAEPTAGSDDPGQRQAVFDSLYGFADPSGNADVALRGELLDRMASVASTTGQEVAYQFYRGGYLDETGQPQRAAEHYQAILADRSLSDELYSVGYGARRAGIEAQRLLTKLIQAHGRGVYQRFDLMAEHEYARLLARGERDASVYTGLADRYPLAAQAADARMRAAELLIEDDQPAPALRQLQAVYLDADTPRVLSLSAGRVVELYLQDGRPELASRWLGRVAREHPGLTLMRGDEPTSSGAWLSELDFLLAGARALPRLSAPLGAAGLIDGWVMSPRAGLPSRDRVVLREGGAMRMLSGSGLDPLWEEPLPAADAELLSMDGRQLIWWSPGSGRLGAVDSRTGEPLWPVVDVTGALDEAGDPRQRLKNRTREQLQFVQMIGGDVRRGRVNPAIEQGVSKHLMAVGPAVVCIADRSGRVVCIDRDSGRVLWRALCPVDSLTSLALGDGLLAVGGASWAYTEARNGVITLLDILTGEPMDTTIQSQDAPLWMGFSDSGLLMTATPRRATAYDPASGRTVWRSELTKTVFTGQGWVGDRLLMLSTYGGAIGSVLVFGAEDGRIVNRLAIRATTPGPQPFDVTKADGGWQVMSPMWAVAIDPSGQVRWSDGVCAPIGHLMLQQVAERYVVLIGRSDTNLPQALPGLGNRADLELEQARRQAAANNPLRATAISHRLYLLDRQTGVMVQDLPLSGLAEPIDPTRAVLIDGALLLSLGDKTLVIRSIHPLN